MLTFSFFGALAVFQCLMHKIVHLQRIYAIAYLNNIAIYSKDWQWHSTTHKGHPKFLETGGTRIKAQEVCNWTD